MDSMAWGVLDVVGTRRRPVLDGEGCRGTKGITP